MVQEKKVKGFTMNVLLEGEAAEVMQRYWLQQGISRNILGRELLITGMKEIGLLPGNWDYMAELRAARNLSIEVKKMRVDPNAEYEQRSFKHLR